TGEGIPPEFFKTAERGSPLFWFLLETFNGIWVGGCFPEAWSVAEVVPVLKKGDATRPENYRGISLIAGSMKVLNKLLARRISDALERHGRLREEQAGFRGGEECLGHCVELEEARAQRKRTGQETWRGFVDFKKAFDTVPQEAVLAKTEERLGLREGGNLSRYLRGMYSCPLGRLRKGTETWKCEVGVRQGCPISPVLFLMFINDLLDTTEHLGVEITGQDKKLSGLLFADDLVLIAESNEKLQALATMTAQWSERWGMAANAQKCAVLKDAGAETSRSITLRQKNLFFPYQKYLFLPTLCVFPVPFASPL
ncbi:MAG: uncharacterized protein A8A55_3339, partial [Amphiamblys sp. WSBS2006]